MPRTEAYEENGDAHKPRSGRHFFRKIQQTGLVWELPRRIQMKHVSALIVVSVLAAPSGGCRKSEAAPNDRAKPAASVAARAGGSGKMSFGSTTFEIKKSDFSI